MKRFVQGDSRTQSILLPESLDDYVTDTNPVRVIEAKRNHGLPIDPQDRVAFVACQDNETLLSLDMRTMRLLSTSRLGGGPDVLAYDPGLHLLYVAGEAGVLSLFRVDGSAIVKLGTLMRRLHD
jgi:hypothetical protein